MSEDEEEEDDEEESEEELLALRRDGCVSVVGFSAVGNEQDIVKTALEFERRTAGNSSVEDLRLVLTGFFPELS